MQPSNGVVAAGALNRIKSLMMKRVMAKLKHKAVYWALRDWECNLQDDNQVPELTIHSLLLAYCWLTIGSLLAYYSDRICYSVP